MSDVREMEQRLSARDMSFDPTPDADEEENYSPAMYLNRQAGEFSPARAAAMRPANL